MTAIRAAAVLVVGAILGLVIHASGLTARRGPAQATPAQLRVQLEARGHPAALGQAVPWVLLRDAQDRPVRHALPADGRPVVIWFWSCLCRCVRDCEERIVSLLERYPAERVHFFAVASNPDDSTHDIHKLRMAMGSPYVVFRDVEGATARHLGVDASASVAVLDGEGRVRYRGAIDNDLYEPTFSYIDAALEAILAGTPMKHTSAPSYGCRFPLPARAPR
ncbi:MAG: redoxin domain-containing protein [Planctomycetota bacterium]|nr:redoxin domain-containing protein [Planctomycetota bacterium]